MVSAEGVGPWGVKAGARRAAAAPQQAPPDYPAQDQYRRDSIIYILKLVNTRECHSFVS